MGLPCLRSCLRAPQSLGEISVDEVRTAVTRAPLDLGGGRPISGAELNIARQVIIRSGVVDALRPLIDSGTGRPRHLSLLGLLVACQLNALGRHHQAHLVEVARTLNAMTEVRGAVSRSATGTPTRPITGSSGSLFGSVRFWAQVRRD